MVHGLSLAVRITFGHEDQAQVQGDADLLKQVVLNLVDNAITDLAGAAEAAGAGEGEAVTPETDTVQAGGQTQSGSQVGN